MAAVSSVFKSVEFQEFYQQILKYCESTELLSDDDLTRILTESNINDFPMLQQVYDERSEILYMAQLLKPLLKVEKATPKTTTPKTTTSITPKRNHMQAHNTSKLRRKHFTREQFKILEEMYFANSFVSKEERMKIAVKFNVEYAKIKRWFENRRYYDKYGHKKIKE